MDFEAFRGFGARQPRSRHRAYFLTAFGASPLTRSRRRYPALSERAPSVKSVARVGSISVYTPTIDPDGLCAPITISSALRGPKFQIRFTPRRRVAQGRERPGGWWGWALQREGEVAGHPARPGAISTGIRVGDTFSQVIILLAAQGPQVPIPFFACDLV